MRQAAALNMHYRQFQSVSDSWDYARYMAFSLIDGMPQPWLQTGMLCSVIAGVSPAGQKEEFNPKDFMPIHRTIEYATPEQLRILFNSLGNCER